MAKSKQTVFAVFGLGTFGRTVASVLAERGATVMAVDNNQDVIDEIKNKVSAAMLIDLTNENAMTKAPFEEIDTAVIAIDDMETSIIATAILKKRGIPYIVCRAVSSIHAQVLRQIGANEVINLQEDEGIRIASRLVSPEIIETIPVTASCSIAEFYVPDMFIDQFFSSIAIETKFHLHAAGIKRVTTELDSEGNTQRTEQLLYPEPDDKLCQGDILILIGSNQDLELFKNSI